MKTEIYKYQQFIDNQTLYVFDFDDTLVNTPSFEDKAKVFIGENLNTKDLLDSVTREIGVNLFDLRYQDGRIFVNDPDELINQSKHWIRKGKRLYLITPDIFSYTKDSMPDSLKEWSELYKNADNKCIVTARPEAIREMVIKTLSDFGLELPKYGLHMMPQGRTNAGMWKGEKIVEIINKTGFRKAIFFDDNSKYIKKATKVIKEKLPNLIWEPVKVS